MAILTRISSSVGSDVGQIAGCTPLAIGARLGAFEVTSVIHQGEFYVVYAGADRSSLREIAVKEYLPTRLADRMANGDVGVRSLRHQGSFRDGLQGFLTEARMLAAHDEPALVKVLRFWEQHGTAYMAMPLYEGLTLDAVLRDSPKPSEAWLKTMLGPLLDALATLHRSEFYPGVTPANIAVLSDGCPLLFDVGTARRIVAHTKKDGTVVPDSGYAPIEQDAGDSSMPEGPWTDIYAVAAVLHLAITGKPPLTPAARMVSDTMPPLRDMTSDYSELFLDGVDRGLAVRPEHRPQTIAEFRETLGISPLASDTIPMRRPAPTPPPLPEHVPPPASSQTPGSNLLRLAPWKLVVSSFVVVGLAGLAVLIRTQTASPPVVPGEGAATEEPSTQVVPPSPESRPSFMMQTAAAPARYDDDETSVPVPSSPPAPNAPAAGTGPARQPAPGAGPVNSVARGTAGSATAVAPAPRTGKVQFAIKPWGEIVVDGKTRGVSPPVKVLSIPEGRHRIEVRNGTFPGYSSEIDIKPGRSVSIAHSFQSP